MTDKKRILIDKTAYGSDYQKIGETCLYYTERASDFARNFCLSFSDSSYELNPEHSTFMLMYDTTTERYIFTHVQAQEWVFEGSTRKYPFRGAYEIGQKDYLNNSICNIVSVIPRINHSASIEGKIGNETEIATKNPTTPDASINLSVQIQNAILQGKYLYITIDKPDGDLRGNAIFESTYLKTLLSAIDHLPQDIKAYATFSFLADNHYNSRLQYCTINICLADSGISESKESINMSWNDAVSCQAGKVNASIEKFSYLIEGIRPVPDALNYIRRVNEVKTLVCKCQFTSLSDDDWTMWLETGNEFSSLPVTDKESYTKLAEIFAGSDKLKEHGIKYAESIITSDFLKLQITKKQINDAKDIEFWEKELDSYSLWDKATVDVVWSMWKCLKEDTLAKLISFLENRKLSDDCSEKLEYTNGVGILPPDVDQRFLPLINGYIKNNFNFSDIGSWPTILSTVNDNNMKNYVIKYLKERINDKEAGEIAQKYDQYIDSNKGKDLKVFVGNTKVLLQPICSRLINKDKGNTVAENLLRKCDRILHPNRALRRKLAVACSFGILVGIGLTFGGEWLYNSSQKEGITAITNPPACGQTEDTVEEEDSAAQYICNVNDIQTLAKLYFGPRAGNILKGKDTICVDSIDDIDFLHSLLVHNDSADHVIANIRNSAKEKTDVVISKDTTLFDVIKGLQSGSRINKFMLEDKKIDVPNGKEYNKKCASMPNGDCALSYYFWLIDYIESEEVQNQLDGIKIAY